MQNLQNVQNMTSFSPFTSIRSSQAFYNYLVNWPNLLAYYPMGEASGDVINRAPASLGTLNGTPSGVTQGVAGQVGNGVSFPGTSANVTIGSIGFGTAGTIGFLCNFDTDLTSKYFFDATTGTRYLFYKRADAGYGFYLNGVNIVDASTPLNGLINDSQWTLVLLTWDNSLGSNKQAYYKNGSLYANTNTAIATSSSPTNFFIGKRFDEAQWYQGSMQHFFVMSSAASSTQALKLAQLANLA